MKEDNIEFILHEVFFKNGVFQQILQTANAPTAQSKAPNVLLPVPDDFLVQFRETEFPADASEEVLHVGVVLVLGDAHEVGEALCVLELHHDCCHTYLQTLIIYPLIEDQVHIIDIHLLHRGYVIENTANSSGYTPVIPFADHSFIKHDVLVIIEFFVFHEDGDDHVHFLVVHDVFPQRTDKNKEFLPVLNLYLIKHHAYFLLHPPNGIQRRY